MAFVVICGYSCGDESCSGCVSCFSFFCCGLDRFVIIVFIVFVLFVVVGEGCRWNWFAGKKL